MHEQRQALPVSGTRYLCSVAKKGVSLMSAIDAVARAKIINAAGDTAYICQRQNGKLCVLNKQTKNHWNNRDVDILEIFRVTEIFQ